MILLMAWFWLKVSLDVLLQEKYQLIPEPAVSAAQNKVYKPQTVAFLTEVAHYPMSSVQCCASDQDHLETIYGQISAINHFTGRQRSLKCNSI